MKRTATDLQKEWREARYNTSREDLITYFNQGRGIPISLLPDSLGFLPHCRYYDGSIDNYIGDYPCMVSRVEDSSGKLVNLQRKYLMPDLMTKLIGYPPEKYRAQVSGYTSGVVRLATATNVLAIAEGIETAMSFQYATGTPTWATLGTMGMESFIPPELPLATDIIIVADNDPTPVSGKSSPGLKAALSAAMALERQGRQVSLVVPYAAGFTHGDMNDLLNQKESCDDPATRN